MIKIKGLSKYYNRKKVLDGLNFEIQEGKMYCLAGKNGSGKTTLINMILGIISPNNGIIESKLDNKKDIGVMFQHDIFPKYIKVEEMIKLHLSFYKIVRKSEEINHLLEKLELKDKMHTYVENLSGGQKRKLSFILSIIHDPKLIILDEPTTGMDFESVEKFVEIVKKMKEKNKTILLITHDFYQIDEMVDEVFILEDGNIKHTFEIKDIKNKKVVDYHKRKTDILEYSNSLYTTDDKVIVSYDNKNIFEEQNKHHIDVNNYHIRDMCLKDIFKSIL